MKVGRQKGQVLVKVSLGTSYNLLSLQKAGGRSIQYTFYPFQLKAVLGKKKRTQTERISFNLPETLENLLGLPILFLRCFSL